MCVLSKKFAEGLATLTYNGATFGMYDLYRYAGATPSLRTLYRNGLVERTARGEYGITQAGLSAIDAALDTEV